MRKQQRYRSVHRFLGFAEKAGVREALGYGGQEPRPLDPVRDAMDPELLEPVVRRGPIYRPTPGDRRA